MTFATSTTSAVTITSGPRPAAPCRSAPGASRGNPSPAPARRKPFPRRRSTSTERPSPICPWCAQFPGNFRFHAGPNICVIVADDRVDLAEEIDGVRFRPVSYIVNGRLRHIWTRWDALAADGDDLLALFEGRSPDGLVETGSIHQRPTSARNSVCQISDKSTGTPKEVPTAHQVNAGGPVCAERRPSSGSATSDAGVGNTTAGNVPKISAERSGQQPPARGVVADAASPAPLPPAWL
jgi:hypothetical protein